MPPMSPEKLDPLIAALLVDIRDRLERAAAVAKGAVACAAAGDPQAGLQMALDIEQPVYEVNTLLNAASLLNRCYRE
jgi:hypothetical protein